MPRQVKKSLLIACLVILIPVLTGCPSDDEDDDGPVASRPVSTSVDFGCQPIGAMLMPTLTISNDGPVDIEVDQIRLGGFNPAKVEVSVDPNSVIMIPAMTSVDIDVAVNCLDEGPVRAVASLIQGNLITAATSIFGQCTDYVTAVAFTGNATACTGGGMDGAISFTLACDASSLDILAEVQTYPAHCGCDMQNIDGPLAANGDFDLNESGAGFSCQMTGTLTAPGMYDITTSSSSGACVIDCTGMASR